MATVLLESGNLRINNDLFLNKQSGRGDEMRMLINRMLCGSKGRVHWHEGDSSVCLMYRNENVKVEACLFGSSNLPEILIEAREGKTTVLKTPKERRKPMKKIV